MELIVLKYTVYLLTLKDVQMIKYDTYPQYFVNTICIVFTFKSLIVA